MKEEVLLTTVIFLMSLILKKQKVWTVHLLGAIALTIES